MLPPRLPPRHRSPNRNLLSRISLHLQAIESVKRSQQSHPVLGKGNTAPVPHIALTWCKAELTPTGLSCGMSVKAAIYSSWPHLLRFPIRNSNHRLPVPLTAMAGEDLPLWDWPPEPTSGSRWPPSGPTWLDLVLSCFVFELYPHATLSKTSCNITLKFIFCLLHKHCNITVNTIYIFERYKR